MDVSQEVDPADKDGLHQQRTVSFVAVVLMDDDITDQQSERSCFVDILLVL